MRFSWRHRIYVLKGAGSGEVCLSGASFVVVDTHSGNGDIWEDGCLVMERSSLHDSRSVIRLTCDGSQSKSPERVIRSGTLWVLVVLHVVARSVLGCLSRKDGFLLGLL